MGTINHSISSNVDHGNTSRANVNCRDRRNGVCDFQDCPCRIRVARYHTISEEMRVGRFLNEVKTSLILICSILLSSCMSTIMDDDYSYVHPEVRPFVDEFMNEAVARGYDFDLSRLKIDFGTPNPGACATTYYDYHQIIIDRNSNDWKANPTELVFHELGHLLLHRKHDDERLNRQLYKSIMCGQGSVKFTGQECYRRLYYVDELFNPSTSFPEWASDDYEGIEPPSDPSQPDGVPQD